MTTSSELTAKQKTVEVLRWAMVLPIAIAGTYAGEFVVRLVLHGPLNVAENAESLGIDMAVRGAVHALNMFLFVTLGALTAPRLRLPTAIVLTVLVTILSLMRHLIVQYAAGNVVGVINYIDFSCEMLGCIAGFTLIRRFEKGPKTADQ